VQLINWSGAIIGPGSEWFWAFAQFIVVVVSLFGIYRQLRSQGAANAVQRIEALEGQWTSPRMTYQRLDLAVHLRTHPPDLEGYFKARPILDFITNLENLWKQGYLGLGEIHDNFGTNVQAWVAVTRHVVDLRRGTITGPAPYDFEALVRELRAADRKVGSELPVGAEALSGLLDYAISSSTADLRQEAARQSGLLPAVPGADVPA
jgi:hypothetical protein